MPHATWIPIVIAAAVCLEVTAILAVVFVLKKRSAVGGDPAPGWWILCHDCARAKPLAETGGIKIGATPRRYRTLGGCSGCGRLKRVLIVHESLASLDELRLIENALAGPPPEA